MDGMVTALAIIFPVLLVFSHDRPGVRRIGSVRHWRAESREISLSCQGPMTAIAQFGPISISPHPRVIHLRIQSHPHTVTLLHNPQPAMCRYFRVSTCPLPLSSSPSLIPSSPSLPLPPPSSPSPPPPPPPPIPTPPRRS